MPVLHPSEMLAAFQEAFNSWDPDATTALYEPEAVMVHGPGAQARGSNAIRGVYIHMFKMRPKMQVTTESILQAQDIAFVRGKWKVRGVAPDGSPINQEGRAADVLRRQADGTWLFVVDNPLS
jgi:uncharacterized protein (TIGR02246 family)